eukprot:TRINITY_DN3497_c0_g1_i1.p1 TRINITY_DN3497_c0_g1~~TRINITY_DN3497_c0_g1_i1.p1  ORF type:complete len:133 (+),score=37.06 TRINITY_DN3497_c0_g1_i1:104-502(+)
MADEDLTEAQIKSYFNQSQQEINAISNKISELEIEVNEHNLVITAIEKLEPTRKCYRLVGGVLVERTVGEVLPAVKKNVESLNGVIAQLQRQLETKSKELDAFILKYNIQVKGGPQKQAESSEKTKSTGVLV